MVNSCCSEPVGIDGIHPILDDGHSMEFPIGKNRPCRPLPPPSLNPNLVLNLPHHPFPTYQTSESFNRMPPQEATIDAHRAWVRVQDDLFCSRSGLQEHPLTGSECRAVDRDPVLF